MTKLKLLLSTIFLLICFIVISPHANAGVWTDTNHNGCRDDGQGPPGNYGQSPSCDSCGIHDGSNGSQCLPEGDWSVCNYRCNSNHTFFCQPSCNNANGWYTSCQDPNGNCTQQAAHCNLCGNNTQCYKVAPTNTPTPTNTPVPSPGFSCSNYQCSQMTRPCNPNEANCYSTSSACDTACKPACGADCSQDNNLCARIPGNQCGYCGDKPGGGKSCQPPPVNICNVCTSNQYCSDHGCGNTCDISTGHCSTVLPTATDTPVPSAPVTATPILSPSPTATPVPAECVEAGEPDDHLPNGNPANPNGTSCSSIGDQACNGGWCYGYDSGPKCRTCSQQPGGGPPPVPTATPVQPTLEVTMIPTPTADPNRPTLTPVPPNTTGTPSNRLSQRWVCLQALPCSDPASGCSVASDHRVRLSAKTTSTDPSKPLGGKDTYIFECLQSSTGNKCTTGDSDLDTSAVGSSNLPLLESTYGYTFGGMYYENGVDVAPNPIPAEENNNGDFGAREWESFTSSNVNRMFLAMNNFDPNGVGGELGAQQQGILPFIQGGSKKCVQIRWDPYGEISDTWTLRPVPNAQVFLYQKNNDDSYSLVTDNSVLGGIQNPIAADQAGKYNFNVPDGSYRIEVKAPGYQTYQKDLKQTAGKQEEHKVELTPTTESLFQKAKDYILGLLSK